MNPESVINFVKNRKNELIVTAILLGCGLCLYYFINVLAPFLIALVFAYLFDPVVEMVGRLGMGRFRIDRLTSVLIIYISLFILTVAVGLPILLNVSNGLFSIAHALEAANLKETSINLITRFQSTVQDLPLPEKAKTFFADVIKDPASQSDTLVAVFTKGRMWLTAALRQGAGFFTKLLSAGMQLALVPVLLFYFMLEFRTLDDDFILLMPRPYRPWTRGFIDRVDIRLGGFVRGQLLIAIIFGTIMTIGLKIIGIKHAIILGPLSGIANLVPYLGVVVGLVPAFFIALWQGGFTMTSLWLCFSIVILFVILQTLDGYVFQPRILGPSVELHPLWIMFVLALGQHLMGIMGMILAVPVAAVGRVLLEDLYSILYDEEGSEVAADGASA